MKDVFNAAKEICKNNMGHCPECPLMAYCYDGIFARNAMVSAGEAVTLLKREMYYEHSN